MLTAAHQYDTHYCYARFNRNFRSLVAAVETVIDYKLRFVTIDDSALIARWDTSDPESLGKLHDRVATRWCDYRLISF